MKVKFILLFICFILFSCDKDFLETSNLNAPDLEAALSNPSEWEDIIARQFSILWHATQNQRASFGPATMADVFTSSWNNGGMRVLAEEPRESIENIETQDYYIAFSYDENFKVIGSANDILRVLKVRPEANVINNNGDNIRRKLQASALFLRGMAYGNIALKYDQAQYVTEDIDPQDAAQLPFVKYDNLLDSALIDLDKAIALAQEASQFELGYYNGLPLNQEQLIQLIHTFQAKFILLLSRDNDENLSNDWEKILSLARDGIDFDFSPQGDGLDWWDDFKDKSTRPIWMRVDYRVIAAMAENTPPRFPVDGSHPLPEPVAIDNRLITDMEYYENIDFLPERGLYYFSHYAFTRYAYHLNLSGLMPFILKADNDLMIAEALIRTGGDKLEAASLINNTRVGRGHLTPLVSSDTDKKFIDAIIHERIIELLGTDGAQPYYDRRRLPDDDGSFAPYSGLQPGTAHQFPVPARELRVLGMDIYTFGGI